MSTPSLTRPTGTCCLVRNEGEGKESNGMLVMNSGKGMLAMQSWCFTYFEPYP